MRQLVKPAGIIRNLRTSGCLDLVKGGGFRPLKVGARARLTVISDDWAHEKSWIQPLPSL